jgi:hypothetical protein
MGYYTSVVLKHLREPFLEIGLAIHFPDMRALLLLPLAILPYIIYLRYIHPLSKVPGPFLASTTNLWWIYTVRRRRQHLSTQELHEKYGPLVRITPNEV